MVKRLVIGRYLRAGYLIKKSNFINLNLILFNLGYLFFFFKNAIRELKYFFFFFIFRTLLFLPRLYIT